MALANYEASATKWAPQLGLDPYDIQAMSNSYAVSPTGRALGNPSEAEAARLRAKYPQLAGYHPSQLLVREAWENYLGDTSPAERPAKMRAAWDQILKERPDLKTVMPANLYTNQGAVTELPQGGHDYYRTKEGGAAKRPLLDRNPWLYPAIAVGTGVGGMGLGALTAPAAATGAAGGGTAAGAGGGAAAAGGGAAAGGAGAAGTAGAAGAVLPATQTVGPVGSLATGLPSMASAGGAGGGFMSGLSNVLGGPVGKAIKWGGGALISGLMSKHAQEQAKKYSPEELAAIANSNRIAGQAAEAAAAALGESKPWLRQAGNYYSTLLTGNRAAQSQAVAPAYAAATDIYRGAERNLQQQGIRGAARDVAAADLNRQRASQLAGLVTGVQPGAAEALGKLGIEGTRTAAPLLGTAGNIYGNILGRGMLNRQWATEQGTQAGSAWGNLFRDLMEDFGGGSKKNA